MEKRFAFTLAETALVFLIISIVAGISLGIRKNSEEKIISMQYYSAYNTITNAGNEVFGKYGTERFELSGALCKSFKEILNTVVSDCTILFGGDYEMGQAALSTTNGLILF